MRIVILGSCQVSAIHPAMQQMLPEAEIIGYHVDTYPPTPRPEILASLKATDLVVSQITADEDDPLHFDRVRAAAPKAIFLPIFYFSGAQPDFAHIHFSSDLEARHPTGYIHSALIAACYCLGLSASQTSRLYSRYGAARSGLAAAYDESRQATIRGYAEHGYDISEAFGQWEAAGRVAYTPNHPASRVLATLSRLALNKLGFDYITSDPVDVPDYLGTQLIWPSINTDLPPGGGARDLTMQLSAREAGEVRTLPLVDYIEASFRLYEGQEAVLMDRPHVAAIADALRDVARRPGSEGH